MRGLRTANKYWPPDSLLNSKNPRQWRTFAVLVNEGGDSREEIGRPCAVPLLDLLRRILVPFGYRPGGTMTVGLLHRCVTFLLAVSLAGLACMICSGGEKALAQSCDPGYVEGEILVRVKADASEEALDRIRGLNGESPEIISYSGIWVVELPAGLSVPEAVDLYGADPAVEFAEPNGLMYAEEVSCVEPVVQAGAIVSTSGVLSNPPFTTYQYGSYALGKDANSRARYALDGGVADLDALVGKKVNVTGVVVPGYENGRVEGGPTLLKVTAIEAAPDAAGLPPELISSNARVVVEEGVAEWRNSGFADDSLDGIASETVSLSASYGTVQKAGYGEKIAWAWSAPVPKGSAGRPDSVTITASDSTGLRSKVTFEVGIRAVSPVVEVTAPAEGATVGGVAKLSVRAADASGMSSPVSFYVDGKEVGQDQEAPYEIEWDSSSHPDGRAEVTASVRDGYEFSGLSAPRKVVVDNTAPAAPAIAAPVAGALLNKSAFVLPGTGEPASTVEVFEGAASRGKTVVDGSGAWSLPLSGVADGGHVYRATSTDVLGRTSPLSGERVVTVDTGPPGVVGTSPAHRATTVATGANISATFSERMDPSSLNDRTFVLFRLDTATSVPATIRYDATRNRVVLDPRRDLRPGKSYAVYLYTGARDPAGNGLAANKTWKFTVRR